MTNQRMHSVQSNDDLSPIPSTTRNQSYLNLRNLDKTADNVTPIKCDLSL